MPRELATLEQRLEWLAEEILLIKESLAGLSCRIEALEHDKVYEGSKELPVSREPIPEPLVQPETLEPIEEESWAQIGQNVLLPRIAAVSFMLVVALILRTVTDNGMINLMAGSVVGFVYASGLIGSGFYLYMKKSRLAPVFPTCGVLLLFSIIFETHTHFAFLPINNVYLILFAVETVVLLIGLKCRSSVLLYTSVFGSSIVGIVLDFKAPEFSMVAMIFFVNIVAGHLAARYSINTKLRWNTLVFATVMWMLWSYKLNFALNTTPDKAVTLGLVYFLPSLFVYWAFYTYTSLWKTLKSGMELGVFHTFLPAIVCGGAFFAANAVLKPWIGKQGLIGLVTVCISACFIGLVAWLARRQDNDVPGGKEFVTAATVLLIQGLSISVHPLIALPVWALAAGVLTVRSSQWRSGGIRVISYLFQMFIVGYALKGNMFEPGNLPWLSGAFVAGILSFTTVWLFNWCRKNPPDYESVFFGMFDKKDYFAVILLVIGLFDAFICLRFIASGVLTIALADPVNALFCAQSVIVNLGIVFLLITGLKMRNKEVLVVAGVIVVIAATKVFLFDLLRTNGLPLVLSVFSFGVVAATSSIVMRKWSVSSSAEAKQQF